MSDKPEWNLNGQTLTFTFNPRETVSKHLAIFDDISISGISEVC